MISAAALEAVKDDIISVVSSRVDVRKQGGKFIGHCPFHSDRHPSFEVNPRKHAFFCNVCNLGGDVIKFIELFHGVDFRGACGILGLAEEAVSRERSQRYQSVLKRLREDEAAQLERHKERTDDLCFASRACNKYFSGDSRSEAVLSWRFRVLDKVEDFIKEYFSDLRKTLREAV